MEVVTVDKNTCRRMGLAGLGAKHSAKKRKIRGQQKRIRNREREMFIERRLRKGGHKRNEFFKDEESRNEN